MKGSTAEPLGPLCVDTDIHYDLDMSKFPGLDDTNNEQPALLISSQSVHEAWSDVITDHRDEEEDDEEMCNEEEEEDEERHCCAFCDALNVAEENASCDQPTEPCYVNSDGSAQTIYIFNDIHECETVEIMDDSCVLHYEEEVICEDSSEEKTYWLNTSSQENSIYVPEEQSNSGSSVIPVVRDLSFNQLTSCQYMFQESEYVPPPSPYMDMCITEQLPLFIDLVDQLSPILSPSGHVRSRKGDNSLDYANDSDLSYFLASDEGLMTIDTSMTSVNHVISKENTIFPRGS